MTPVRLHQCIVEEASEILRPHELGPLVLSCDHASPRLPAPWRWSAADQWILGTHWSFDLGAAKITRALAQRLRCPAVLARFTRLLIDPNRESEDDTLLRREAESRPIALNQNVTNDEREHRLDTYYRPYHERLHDIVAEHPGVPLLSIHTFTPVYEGNRREMHGGVLFNRYEALAREYCEELAKYQLNFAENEPYSGYDGLIHGIERHGTQHDRVYLELEIRQDLAQDPYRSRDIVEAIANVTESLMLHGELHRN